MSIVVRGSLKNKSIAVVVSLVELGEGGRKEENITQAHLFPQELAAQDRFIITQVFQM